MISKPFGKLLFKKRGIEGRKEQKEKEVREYIHGKKQIPTLFPLLFGNFFKSGMGYG